MSFSGSVVEVFGDGIAFVLGQSTHAFSLGQMLPDQPVGVCVRPALPAMVGRGEVEPHPAHRFDSATPMEPGSVV